MPINAEYARLATVIQYSERVKKLREMAKLQKNEFILDFDGGSTTVRTMEPNEKGYIEVRREKRKLYPGKSDLMYFYREIELLLRPQIIDYFQIDLDDNAVFHKIFRDPPELPSGALVHHRINGRGHFEIIIELETMPNLRTIGALYKELQKQLKEIQDSIASEPRRQILEDKNDKLAKELMEREEKALKGAPKKVADAIRKLRADYRVSKMTTPIQGEPQYFRPTSGIRHIDLEEPLPERLSSPRLFDKKYAVALVFYTLQGRKLSKERTDAMEKLAQYAAEKVVGRNNFNADELRKTMFDFNKSFEVRLPKGGIILSGLNPELSRILM